MLGKESICVTDYLLIFSILLAFHLFQNLIDRLNLFLNEDRLPTIKVLSLQLLLVLATVSFSIRVRIAFYCRLFQNLSMKFQLSEVISENTILEYMMVNSLFESLMQVRKNEIKWPDLSQDKWVASLDSSKPSDSNCSWI